MTVIQAHFDGKVIVPDEPVDLPANQTLIVRIEEVGPSALAWLDQNAVEGAHLPIDMASEHDHYPYGMPKKQPERR